MATYSNTLAWTTPWTEGPDGLQSMGLQRIGHLGATEHAHTHGKYMSNFIKNKNKNTKLV